MTIFWILAAGLLLLALLFVVLPLLRGTVTESPPDQDALNLEVFQRRLAELDSDLASGFLDRDRYEAARRDLERELLYDLDGTAAGSGSGPSLPLARAKGAPWLATLLALILPAGVVLAYLQLGDPEIVSRIESAPLASAGEEGHSGAADGLPAMDVLVQRLAEKLEESPDNPQGWLMLGRSYLAMGQADKALGALERAYKLIPTDATVVVSYAEALAANNGNSLEGRPAELIRTALEIEPKNPNALWLDGMLSYQRDRFAEAARTWEGVLAEMDPQGEEVQDMRRMIAEARRRAGEPAEVSASAAPSPGQPATEDANAAAPPASAAASAEPATAAPSSAASSPAGTAGGGASIQVSVSLSPQIAAQASPGDTVFVFARAAAGPPMPLAASRIKVSDLPASVSLDDSMAMVPGMSLSAFPQVLVGARVSKSGQATPQSGDLEGVAGPVDSTGNPEVSVTVDRVRP